jgi:DNA repair protein RadC
MPKIKDIPAIDRPREKFEKYGPGKLSDAELLAILLRTGSKGLNAVEVGKRLIGEFGKPGLAAVSVKDLKKAFGLGPAKACEIAACFELGRRFLRNKPSALLLTAKDVWENLPDIRAHRKEHFVVFYLDSRHQEIRREIVSVGTLTASLVHPREVFESAVRHRSAHVLVAHNHPSGNPEPSPEDHEVTRRLAEAGRLLGIELIDHVIVTKDAWWSFKGHGVL